MGAFENSCRDMPKDVLINVLGSTLDSRTVLLRALVVLYHSVVDEDGPGSQARNAALLQAERAMARAEGKELCLPKLEDR